MEILLGIIIIALLSYSVYKDWLYHKHLSELENKFMSKDFTDYKYNTTPVAPEDKDNGMAEEDKYQDLDQVPNPMLSASGRTKL